MSATLISNGATFSPDRLYRYSLWRYVGGQLGRSDGSLVTFVMLNPSTADDLEDDPTIRRCIGFARTWGFEGLKVVNLYGYRSTDPRKLADVDDPVGPENDHHVALAVGGSDLVVCAWGARAAGNANRIGKVLSLIGAPHCLGRTADGFPAHPLYLARFTMPVPFAHCPIEAAWSR